VHAQREGRVDLGLDALLDAAGRSASAGFVIVAHAGARRVHGAELVEVDARQRLAVVERALLAGAADRGAGR
jgi:hypothetical protein